MLKLPVKSPIVNGDIDLSEYAKKSDVDAIDASLDNKAEKKDVEKISSQLDTKANKMQTETDIKTLYSLKSEKSTTDSLQSQINNLVLNSGGDSNLEVVQSRTNSVGSIFYNSKNHIDNIEKAIFNKIDRKYRYKWAIGTTNATTGETHVDLTRITTDGIIYADKDLKISVTDYTKYKYGIRKYPNYPSLDGSVDAGWISTDTIIPQGTYFRINVSKFDNTTHNMSDAMTGELFDAISILDGKTIEEFLPYNIKQIDSDVLRHNFIINRYSPLKLQYNYEIGYLSSNGIIDTNRKFRISTSNKILADKEIVGEFDIINYIYWIVYFDSDNKWLKTDEFSKFTKINKTIIPANSIFMITMGRATMDTTEVFTSVYNDVFDGFSLYYSDSNNSTFEDIKKNKEDIENIKKNGIGVIVNEKGANVLGIAHRGLPLECPENTMIAYKEAYNKGFRILETDIKLTSDDVLVLLHDQTINRTARNSDGSVISEEIDISSITYEEALNYDFGVYKGSEFAGEKIPRLEDLLLFAKKKNCIVYIDGFASSLINKIFLLVNKLGMIRNVIWSSFVKSDLQQILTLDKKAHVVYLYSGSTIENSIIDDASTLKTDFNEVSFATYYPNVTDLGLIEYAHYKGIRFGIYTVNINSEIIRFVNAGVDEITTDGINVAQVMLDDV